MTIIFQSGEFWIESFFIPVILGDAGGKYTTAVHQLEKGGHCVGASVTGVEAISSNKIEQVGVINILGQDSNTIEYGEELTGIRVSVQKVTSSGGENVFVCSAIVYMRK